MVRYTTANSFLKVMARNQSGNILVLTLVSVILLVTVGLLVLNYNQLLGVHKEAQTAVDAASLQAAKDMGRIVADGPIGRIALLDDSPGSNGYPVQSVNTVLGSLRLDALIASRLNNKTLSWLVKQDLARAQVTIDTLKQQIVLSAAGSSGAYDKNGNAVNVRQNALDVYRSNQIVLAGKSASSQDKLKDFRVTPGILSTAVSSQVPVPTPTTGDPVNFTASNSSADASNKRYYLSNTDYPVPGLSGSTVRFSALESQPALVDASRFTSALSANDIPYCVQVSTAMEVNPNAQKDKIKAQNLASTSVAQAGGPSFSPSTGSLMVRFAGPIPTDPAASGANPLKFGSVVGIMNASQFDPATSNPTSSYNGWNAQSQGTWRVATGGPVPGSGSLTPSPYKNMTGRGSDDPSIGLTFLVYDWLRSLGLRPNVDSIVSALNFDYRTFNGSTKQFTNNINDKSQWMPAAYAADTESLDEAAPILRVDADSTEDPRNLANIEPGSSIEQRQQARMWGSVSADGVLGPETKLIKYSPDGAVTTMDGNPASDVNDLLNQFNLTLVYSNLTFENVNKVMSEKAKELAAHDPQVQALMSEGGAQNESKLRDLIMKVFKANPRLEAIYANSQYASRVASTMRMNMKVLSGGGVKKISSKHFVVMGANFYPVGVVASVEQIRGDGKISTDQDSSVGGSADWALPLNGDKSSRMMIYQQANNLSIPVANKSASHGETWLQPAMAQSAQPANAVNRFIFHVVDSQAAKPGSYRVSMTKLDTTPFANSTLKGQAHYQNVTAVIVPASNDPNQKIAWQVQARDLNANAYPAQSNASAQPNPSAAASHYSTQTSPSNYCGLGSGVNCPGVVSEWAMTCPVVQAPPPPPPPPAVPPPPPCVNQWVASPSGRYGIFQFGGNLDSRGQQRGSGRFVAWDNYLVGSWPWLSWAYNTAIGGPYYVSEVWTGYWSCDRVPLSFST